MIKALIVILAVVLLGFGVVKIVNVWDESAKKEKEQAARVSVPSGSQLSGLPSALEGVLEASQKRGAAGLRNFLTQYGKNIQDPRLASIELDYVVLVAKDDPAEARRVFARVKQRTGASSPVYPRVQQLKATYE